MSKQLVAREPVDNAQKLSTAMGFLRKRVQCPRARGSGAADINTIGDAAKAACSRTHPHSSTPSRTGILIGNQATRRDAAARLPAHRRYWRHLDAQIAARAGVFDSLVLDDAYLLGNHVELFARLDPDLDERATIVRAESLTAQLKLAAPHGVTVPKNNSDTSILDSLRSLKGKAFDTAYTQKFGLDGHKQAI